MQLKENRVIAVRLRRHIAITYINLFKSIAEVESITWLVIMCLIDDGFLLLFLQKENPQFHGLHVLDSVNWQ